MNITIDNFNEYKDKIKTEIDTCDYVAIDCELSGITPYYMLNLLDTLEERYLKLKKNDSQYLLLQMGLCFFKKQNKQMKGNDEQPVKMYDTSSYNFFLFPRIENKKYSPKYNDRCQIQVTAIEFLSKNNFDFNKVFVKGISYMTKEHERKMREKILKTNEENKNENEKEFDVEKELKILEDEAAFSTIMWHLSESKKLIIGHNMLVDTMFILKHFFVQQLPNSCQEFRTCLHSIFPNIIDTKNMAFNQPFAELKLNTYLIDLYTGLCEKVKVVKFLNKIYDDEANASAKQLHESAYDAYLTGCCYGLMKESLPGLDKDNKFGINDYENKLHLMKINGYLHLDLVNEQEIPPTDSIFYVEFPKDWTRKELDDLFQPYGTIAIRWVNDISALCLLQNKKNIEKVNQELVNKKINDNDSLKILLYDDFKKGLSMNTSSNHN